MTIKLYGMAMATCTKRVRVVLEELNAPYELVPVDLFGGEQKQAAFREKQPFGQIPYIEDTETGLVVFESRAICRYVALKYGGAEKGLIPRDEDLASVARFEQAASVETSNFDPYASGLAYENIFKPRLGTGEPNPVFVQHYKSFLAAKLDGYEALLSKAKYVAGDHITLVDLFHLPYGTLLGMQGYDFLKSEKHPNVARWWEDISSRPTWAKVLQTQ